MLCICIGIAAARSLCGPTARAEMVASFGSIAAMGGLPALIGVLMMDSVERGSELEDVVSQFILRQFEYGMSAAAQVLGPLCARSPRLLCTVLPCTF